MRCTRGACVSPAGQRGQACHENGEVAAGEPLRGHGATLVVGHAVAVLRDSLGHDHHFGSRPRQGVVNVDILAGDHRIAHARAGRKRTDEQFPRLEIRLGRERLLDLPLVLRERGSRLGDRAIRPPSVLGVEQDVPPGVLERSRGVARGIDHGPKSFGLGEPVRTRSVHARLQGRRARAILPVGRPVAADPRQLLTVPRLESPERLAG